MSNSRKAWSTAGMCIMAMIKQRPCHAFPQCLRRRSPLPVWPAFRLQCVVNGGGASGAMSKAPRWNSSPMDASGSAWLRQQRERGLRVLLPDIEIAGGDGEPAEGVHVASGLGDPADPVPGDLINLILLRTAIRSPDRKSANDVRPYEGADLQKLIPQWGRDRAADAEARRPADGRRLPIQRPVEAASPPLRTPARADGARRGRRRGRGRSSPCPE